MAESRSLLVANSLRLILCEMRVGTASELKLLKPLDGYVLFLEEEASRLIDFQSFFRPGFVKVVPREGMPLTSAPNEKGDLHIHFNVEVPKTLTPEQKKTIGKTLP